MNHLIMKSLLCFSSWADTSFSCHHLETSLCVQYQLFHLHTKETPLPWSRQLPKLPRHNVFVSCQQYVWKYERSGSGLLLFLCEHVQ